jgi:site-specific recombinase XerD
MKTEFINSIMRKMRGILSEAQSSALKETIESVLLKYEVYYNENENEVNSTDNACILATFINAKKVEGCSEKTLKYYTAILSAFLSTIHCAIKDVNTSDIRSYLSNYQEFHQSSKVTIDNMRRIFSSFFAWLEDEDYIRKSPVRRIHRVKADTLVKETINEEQLEILRDSCTEIRDLAIIDVLASTGMRVGELVNLDICDVDFQERQCIVFGKGHKEREVYFNSRAKLHLQQYLRRRKDSNPALFVSLKAPHTRLTISGVETRVKALGENVNLAKVHPHKFRRTFATMAIDKGMPIEQVQRLLGHVKIDTTLQYAMVNQSNVKVSHRKFFG